MLFLVRRATVTPSVITPSEETTMPTRCTILRDVQGPTGVIPAGTVARALWWMQDAVTGECRVSVSVGGVTMRLPAEWIGFDN